MSAPKETDGASLARSAPGADVRSPAEVDRSGRESESSHNFPPDERVSFTPFAVDREQVRRDATTYRADKLAQVMLLSRHVLALLAELEQAERERDEARGRDSVKLTYALEQALERSETERKQALRERDETWVSLCRSKETELRHEAQLAKVPALVEFAKKRGHDERCASYRHDYKIRFRDADPLPCLCGLSHLLAVVEQAQGEKP